MPYNPAVVGQAHKLAFNEATLGGWAGDVTELRLKQLGIRCTAEVVQNVKAALVELFKKKENGYIALEELDKLCLKGGQ